MTGFPSNLVSRTLENGLQFVARVVPQLPVTSTMMWYRAGSAHETPGKTGVAHCLEHMLFKGTSRLRQGQIDRITQRHGGVNNAFTWLDSTAYVFNFSSTGWRVALDIEAERMRGSLLDAKEFALEKAVILEERSIEMDAPEGMLLEEVNRAAFSAHPYGQPVIGWLEDLERLEAQDLWAFYEAHYVPNNAHVVMVGDFDIESAFAHVRSRFGQIPPGAPHATTIVEPPQRAERRVVLERQCEAPRLSMAFHVPQATHPDTAALALLDILLSSGRTSRLHERLVDREKVATSVDSGFFETREPYLFFVNVELHPGVSLADAEGLVLEELERIGARGPDRKELVKGKKLFESDWVLDHQTAEDQGMHVGEAMCWGDLEALVAFPGQIAEVRGHDLQRVAKHYFTRANRTVGHLVPLKRNPAIVSIASRATKTPALPSRFQGRRNVERSSWKPPTSSRAVPRIRIHGETLHLKNGLKVLVLSDASTPSFVAELLAPSGSRYETDAKAGRSALLGRMLSEGTASRSAQELALGAERIGAKLETSAGYRFVRVAVEALTADLDLGLELIADIAQRSSLPRAELLDRRREQLSLLTQLEDESRAVGQRWFNELVYQGHPAHRLALGTPESVVTLNRRDLVHEYQRAFAPGACTLTIAGDLPVPARIVDVLERHFGEWTAPTPPPRPDPPAPRRQTKPRAKVIRRTKEQVHLFVGHLGIRRLDPDFEVAVVLDHILGTGSGFTDRLSQRLRDREGLAYSVYASLSGTAGIDPGVFQAYIGTSPEHVQRALTGIREEVQRIREEPVSRRELDAAKRFILGQYAFGFQTNRDLVGYAQMCDQFGWPMDYYRHFLDLVGAVQPDDILRVAQRCLDADCVTTVAVGPLSSRTVFRTPA